jgi:hypothetical protein
MNVFIIDPFGRRLQAVDLAPATVQLLCDGFMVCASLLNDTDDLYVRERLSGRHYFEIGQNRIFGLGLIVGRRQGRRPRGAPIILEREIAQALKFGRLKKPLRTTDGYFATVRFLTFDC